VCTHGETKNACRILVRKSEEKRDPERHRYKLMDNIRMDPKEI
jgi:hypothetical protein